MILTGRLKIFADASEKSAVKAAEELSCYLKKMTGEELSVEKTQALKNEGIYVGRIFAKDFGIDTNSLGSDGIAILCKDNKLLFTGEGTRGTLYAVYSFLEDNGVRFYATDCEYIPQLSPIEVKDGYEKRYSPVITMRNVLWSDGMDPALTAKQKVNCCWQRKFPEELGGGKKFAGYFCHTFGELAETGYEASEPCLTDEKVYQTILKNVRQRLRDNPDAEYISVSQNDDFRFCTCENCKKIDDEEESHSGTMIRFVNRIADDIKDEFPNVLIHTFAYQYTRKPPKFVRPRDNVIVQLCSIECCFRHPLETCKTPAPAPWMEGTVGDFAEDLREWHRIAKNIHIWDYTTDYHHYFAPFPNLRVLRENVQFFVKNGVTGVLEQGNINSPASGEFGALKNYLLTNLLWDPQIGEEEYEKMIDDFLCCYYGSGWKFIRQYIDALHEETKDRHIGIYYHPLRILPPENGLPFMRKAQEWFEKAYSLAETKEQKTHVKRSMVQVKYYIQLATYKENMSDTEKQEYEQKNKELWDVINEEKIYLNPDITLPETVDFSVSPDLWHKLG